MKLNAMGSTSTHTNKTVVKSNVQIELWTEEDFRYKNIHKIRAESTFELPVIGDNYCQLFNSVADGGCTV